LLLGVERACPVGILGRRWNLDAQRLATLAFGPRGGFLPGGVSALSALRSSHAWMRGAVSFAHASRVGAMPAIDCMA
jgi:hypothetical protein